MRTLLLLFFFSITLFSSEINFTSEEKEFIKNHKPIKIASIKLYVPFSFERNGEKIGFTNDLITLISEKSGLKFERINGSWSSIYKQFKNNEVDIISEISFKEERLDFTQFTKPYYEVPIGVFSKGLTKYEGIKTLKNKRVGILKGSFFISFLKDIGNIKIFEFKSEEEKLFSLLDGKTDFIISNAMTENYTRSFMYKDIKLSGYFENEKINKEDLRFGIRKENKLLSSIFIKTFNSIAYTKMAKLKDDWIYTNNKVATQVPLNSQELQWIKNNKISVGIETAKPYIYFNDETDDIDGFYADIFKLIIDKTNLEVEYKKESWSELLKGFKKNKIDLLPATFFSKGREEFGLFSRSYYQVREYIYTKSMAYDKLKNLNKKKVAIVKGYATIKKLKEKFPAIKIIETDDLAESVALVLDGTVDALIDYHLVVEKFLLDNEIVQLKGLPQTYLDSASVHYFSQKDKPMLNKILQKGLNGITEEEKNKLYKKWFNKKNINNTLTKKELTFVREHPNIRVRIKPNKPPYEFIKDGKASGIAVDYIKLSAKKIGLNIKFVPSNDSVKDSYNEIENKREKYDTLIYSVKSPKREKRFSFGADFLSYPMMIISHKNAPYIDSMKSLVDKTIVLEKGFLTNKWIKKDYPEIKIINAPDTKSALEMVNNKEALAYVGNLAVANYLRIYEDLENIEIVAPSGYGDINFSFIAPKEWPELSSLLSKGYSRITPVEHSAIQQKWFSIQKIEKNDYSLILKILAISTLIILWILWWNRKLTKERDKTKIAIEELKEAKSLLEVKNKEVLLSQHFLESILDESPNPIVIKNYEGKFVLVNQAVATLYNTTKKEMIGKDDGDYIEDKELAEFFRKNVQDIMDKGEVEVVYEDSQDAKTGKIRHYMSTKKPFLSVEGEQLILVIANDITEIKKLENEKLRNQELIFNQSKTAAMGEMIGNIAHQWRQPLSVISTASTGLLMEKEIGVLTDEKLISTLKSINEYTQHLSKTIETFRNYIKDTKEFKEVILQVGIKTAIDIVSAAFNNNFIKMTTNIDEIEPIKINLISAELSEVLINILNNSKDALKERKVEYPWVDLHLIKQNDKVIITIEDNAGGIDKEIINRVFEPYFTTKHKSQGTGLGLHMSYKIITESLRGKIYVVNSEYGAKFTIELPLN